MERAAQHQVLQVLLQLQGGLQNSARMAEQFCPGVQARTASTSSTMFSAWSAKFQLDPLPRSSMNTRRFLLLTAHQMRQE
jgi:hypothetical protein